MKNVDMQIYANFMQIFRPYATPEALPPAMGGACDVMGWGLE